MVWFVFQFPTLFGIIFSLPKFERKWPEGKKAVKMSYQLLTRTRSSQYTLLITPIYCHSGKQFSNNSFFVVLMYYPLPSFLLVIFRSTRPVIQFRTTDEMRHLVEIYFVERLIVEWFLVETYAPCSFMKFLVVTKYLTERMSAARLMMKIKTIYSRQLSKYN